MRTSVTLAEEELDSLELVSKETEAFEDELKDGNEIEEQDIKGKTSKANGARYFIAESL